MSTDDVGADADDGHAVTPLELLALSTGFDGAARAGLVAAALLIDMVGPLLARDGWKVHAEQFAERRQEVRGHAHA